MDDIKFLRRSSAGNTGLGVDLESNEIFDMAQKMKMEEQENSDVDEEEIEEQANPELELFKNRRKYSDKETDHLLWTIMSRQQPCTARESYYISR